MVAGRTRRIKLLIASLFTFYGIYKIVSLVEDTSDFHKVIYPKRLGNLSGVHLVDSQEEEHYTNYLLPKLEEYYRDHVVKRRSQHFAEGLVEPFTTTNENFWAFFPAINSWCPHPIERIGGIKWNWKWRGEGGKWICGLDVLEQASTHQHSCVVYSYGIGDDTSFESALLARTNCSVFMYDLATDPRSSSLQILEKYSSRARFSKVGLGPENFKANEFTYRTLRTEMKRNQHKFIDVLKIDIEGAEFGSFQNILEEFSRDGLPFGQLQIELHVTSSLHYSQDLNLWNKFRGWYEALEKAGLRAFMSEPNPVSNIRPQDNVKFYEYSLINVRSQHFILRNYTLPRLL